MLKHQPKKELPCPAVNCKKTFYRSDKLKDHLRKGHDKDTYFSCPVQGCVLPQKFSLRDEMKEHLGGHDLRTANTYKGQFDALM